MDHLPEGHRHGRAPHDPAAAVRPSDQPSASPERTAAALLAEREDQQEFRPRSGGLLISALGLLLCSSAVATGSIINTSSAPNSTVVAEPPGQLALRPDLLRDSEWPLTSTGDLAAVPEIPTEPPQPPQDTPDDVEDGSDTEVLAQAQTANPRAGSDEQATEVVDEFYRRLPESPEAAARMLPPGTTGDRESFTEAWNRVSEVQHRSQARSATQVVTEVTADYSDGHRVRLRQLVRVSVGTEPEIVDVELILAQHLGPGANTRINIFAR